MLSPLMAQPLRTPRVDLFPLAREAFQGVHEYGRLENKPTPRMGLLDLDERMCYFEYLIAHCLLIGAVLFDPLLFPFRLLWTVRHGKVG